MTNILQQFLEDKNNEKEQKKIDKADVTLAYYEKIGEMLESGGYDKSESFLYSVQQFIEKSEFISDRQMEIVDRIYNHPEDNTGEIPF